MIKGDSPDQCKEKSELYTGFAKIPRDCQKTILGRMSEFDVANLLYSSLSEKREDLKDVLSYLGERAMSLAPLEGLTGLDPNLKDETSLRRLGELYARSYFRFFSPKTSTPQIRIHENFCKKVDSDDTGCQHVLPLFRYGMMGFRKGGKINIISAISGEQLELTVSDNPNLNFKGVEEYKKNHFMFLMQDSTSTPSQGQSRVLLIHALLKEYKDIEILNQIPLNLPTAAMSSPFKLTSSGVTFVIIDHNLQLYTGRWSDNSGALTTKKILTTVHQIWPYSESQIIVREAGRVFLMSLDQPARLQFLKESLTRLVPFQLAKDAKDLRVCSAYLEATSQSGLQLKLEQGIFTAKFFNQKSSEVTSPVHIFKTNGQTYSALIEITIGLWGVVNSRGGLMVIDGWSNLQPLK
jgi:hypothetical protein